MGEGTETCWAPAPSMESWQLQAVTRFTFLNSGGVHESFLHRERSWTAHLVTRVFFKTSRSQGLLRQKVNIPRTGCVQVTCTGRTTHRIWAYRASSISFCGVWLSTSKSDKPHRSWWLRGDFPPLSEAFLTPRTNGSSSTAGLLRRTILAYFLSLLLHSAVTHPSCLCNFLIVPCGLLYLAAHASTKFQSYF